MRFKILVLLFVSLLVQSVFFLQYSHSASTGDLQILSSPDISILIDEKYVGKTNIKQRGLFVSGLQVGSHSLIAIKNLYQTKMLHFNINQSQTTKLKFELQFELQAKTSNLYLRSAPVGAKVFIDNKFRGETDLFLKGVLVGNYEIKFEMDEDVLKGVYKLSENEALELLADFRKGNIDNINLAEKAEYNRLSAFKVKLVREISDRLSCSCRSGRITWGSLKQVLKGSTIIKCKETEEARSVYDVSYEYETRISYSGGNIKVRKMKRKPNHRYLGWEKHQYCNSDTPLSRDDAQFLVSQF